MDVFTPEQLFYRLQRLGTAERDALVKTLLINMNGHEPNSNHDALALMMAAGAQVWTTNYDTLIEDAVGDSACHVLAWPDPPSCPDACVRPHLMKLHGSFQGGEVEDQSLIFDSEQVLNLDHAWRAAFTGAIAERRVLVAGQRGRDADLMPILRSAAGTVRSGIWYEGDNANRERLQQLLRAFELPLCTDVSEAFLRHCEGLLHLDVARRPVHPSSTVAVPAWPQSRLARAAILEHLESTGRTRRELIAALWFDSWPRKPTALRRSLRSLGFDYRALARPLVALAKPVAHMQARHISARAWSLYLLLQEARVSSDVPQEVRRRLGTHCLAEWSAADRISAASCVKLVGPLDLVDHLIPPGYVSAQGPSLRGKGVFMSLWAQRYMGNVGGWTELWNAESSQALLFDPNWAAWLRLEQADFDCITGQYSWGAKALEADETRFAAERKCHPLFLVDYRSTKARLDMLLGEAPVSPEPHLRALSELRGSLRTGFRTASFEISAASLMGSDDRRRLVDLLADAQRRTPSRLHGVLIGVLQLRHDLGTANPDALLSTARSLGFGYGEALLIRELGLPDTSAELNGARELLVQWTGQPRIWIVP